MSNRRSSVDFTRIFSRTIRFEKNLSPIQFATINNHRSLPLSPFSKKSLWRTEEYYLVAVLYDASMIDRRRFWMRSIIFEISIGNAGNTQFGHSQCFENEEDKEGIFNSANKMITCRLLVETCVRTTSPPSSSKFLVN